MIELSPSPIQSISFENNSLYIKRDDLLHPQFSGNKARKFQYYLDLKDTVITKVVGFGSVQANSLYSLAALCQLRGWQLEYHCDYIPNHLKTNPIGNFAKALALGAKIIAFRSSHEAKSQDGFESHIKQLRLNSCKSSLFIDEGGFGHQAAVGLKALAIEIVDWMQIKQLTALQLVLPSGTGTTAGFLAQSFDKLLKDAQACVKVITCPCVADSNYLREQWLQLGLESDNLQIFPNFEERRFHFGKLNQELYDIWQQIQLQTQIEFELLYDPVAWFYLHKALMNQQLHSHHDNPIMYLHQGGLVANQSMLPRYQRAQKKWQANACHRQN